MRTGAIGDFVLTLPALRALRATFPAHQILLATRADVLPLVHNMLADDVLAADDRRIAALFQRETQTPSALTPLFSDLDVAVLWLPAPRSAIVADHLRRLNASHIVSADPLPTHRHAADHLLDTLALLGISSARFDARPRLDPPLVSPDVAARTRLGSSLAPDTRLVAIHVGSGSAAKRWPLDNFLAVAARIAAVPKTHVLLVSGPAENVKGLRLPANSTYLPDVRLIDLAALLSTCALYLGNDSGITHIAAALGVPTVALFGPTDPAIWGPRGHHVTILRSETSRMDGLGLEQVWSAVYTGNGGPRSGPPFPT